VKTFDAALEGIPEKEHELAVAYESGILKDFSGSNRKAATWYRKAADHGYTESQFAMGLFTSRDNETEAVSWYRKAAEQNHAGGQYNLGYCYESGVGVEKDKLEAKSWYQKAANNGHKGALNALKNI